MSVPIRQEDQLYQRITKLLPADITAAFIAIKSAIPAVNVQNDWVVYGAVVILLLSPAYFFFVLKTRSAIHICFLMATYVIFVMSLAPIEIGNVFPDLKSAIHGLNVIATPIWVFVVTPIVAEVLKVPLEG
jgi:hypothetical protein